MDIVFFGTPGFAVPTLRALVEKHNVLAVVTQPDRPKNRGHRLHFSEVKEEALRLGLPVIQPEKLSVGYGIPEADAYVVVAYGQIFPAELLNKPVYGCFNIHASLLPKYRGAAPIQRAVEAGEDITGVCIMKMDIGLDTGDVLLRREHPCARKTSLQLERELSELGAEMMLEALHLVSSGKAVYTPQSGEHTYARMIKKEDFAFRDDMSFLQNLQKIRAFGFLMADAFGRQIKVFDIEKAESEEAVGIHLKVADGYARVLELQPENSKRMSAQAFMLGIKNKG